MNEYGGTAATQRQLQIPAQMEKLLKLRQSLFENIKNLESRLTPITRPNGPAAPPEQKNSPDRGQMVGLAEAMADAVSDLERACVMLDNLAGRIEL